MFSRLGMVSKSRFIWLDYVPELILAGSGILLYMKSLVCVKCTTAAICR